VAYALSDEEKIIDLKLHSRSLTTNMVGYPSNCLASCHSFCGRCFLENL